jgi:hypothetical protein
MQSNKYLVTNKRTGKTTEVTEQAYNQLKRGVNKNNFIFSVEAQDLGEVAEVAKVKKKTAKKED